MERVKPITFPSAGSHPVQLEGILHYMEAAGEWPAAVVCHPHPLGGGSMHNGVVTAIARALSARGIAALRFNFRGAGRSGGRHDYGRGEQSDVAGALDWLLAQPWIDPWRVSLAGYSFGAWVGLTHAQADARVSAVAAVGLVPWSYEADLYSLDASDASVLGQFEPDFLRSFSRPKLFVAAEHDEFCPPGCLQPMVDRLAEPKRLHIVPGADHFFLGQERVVGALVSEFLRSQL
jgi:alpha/beta superfamily hydrolase